MTKRFRLDFSTAYGQLILLVFLPISVLAMVGGVLVWQDTSRAARTIQRATADNLLNRYQLAINPLQASLEQINQTLLSNATFAKSSPQAVQTQNQTQVQSHVQSHVQQSQAKPSLANKALSLIHI